MLLARAVHFDESDMRIYTRPAATGEWAVPGGVAFSNWTEADLVGKARQDFANGWLGLGSFGRVTLVAVSVISPQEYADLIERLAQHFVDAYGAPSRDAARPFAEEELRFMADLCAGQDQNTLLSVSREMTEAGPREDFRYITPQDAELEAFAVHGELDPPTVH